MLHSKTVGQKIADARKKRNLSQGELAEKIAISPQAVGKWERGESLPDITRLNSLAQILGVDLNYFSDSFSSDESETIEKEVFEEEAPVHSSRSRRKFDWNRDMSRGNWVNADFSGLKNLKEKFSSSNMKNCQFRKADLSGLILANNNIEGCDFGGANIRDSEIRHSNLENNQFVGCSFIDATFLRSNVGKCDFSQADFSGAEIRGTNFEHNVMKEAIWKFTSFKNANIGHTVFEGTMEDCHFEGCSFSSVTFENATLLNCFFKYNSRFKKVVFINCKVDKITYAFLKNNQANLAGVEIIEQA